MLSAETLRVTPEWLQANLAQPGLVILDVRLEADYSIDHIPGALSFPDALTYQQKSAGGRIVEPDVFQTLLRERGVNQNDQVIIYDNGGLIDASRVFWTMEVYGLKQVKVLDKGYSGWLKRGLPITHEVRKVSRSQFVPTVDHRRIASKFSTQLATLNPNQIVVDARPQEAYIGKTSTARRFGHIPTAISIPVHSNISNDADGQTLVSTSQLQDLYSKLPKGQKIILYCEIGRVSSTNYLALRELGHDVANYDASWREWGNDFTLPVINQTESTATNRL